MPEGEKARLRGTMRGRRKALALASPDAAFRAALMLPETRLRGVACVSGYRAIGGEIDPGPLLDRFAAAGAVVALPFAVVRGGPLVFRKWRAGGLLTPDALGVPSPTDGEELTPSVVIAPLLAFDHRGGRLGQGGGLFDRTLAAIRHRGPVLVIGLAFAGQEVEAVPMEPHDQRLDAVLTEAGYREFG